MNRLIMQFTTGIEKYGFMLYLTAIFFLKLPPFYTPFTPSIITTHAIAKIIAGALFCCLFIYDKKVRKIFNQPIFIYIALYVLFQSASVIHVESITSFLRQYQNLIGQFLLFSLAYYYFYYSASKKKLETFCNLIIFIILSSLLLQFFFLIFQQRFLDMLGPYIQKGLLDLYVFNFLRGRIYLYINTEIFLAFLLYFAWINKNDKKKLAFYLLLTTILIFFSILSNFRRPVILTLFQLTTFSLVWLRQQKITILKTLIRFSLIIAILIISCVTAVYISQKLYLFHVFDRFAFKDKNEDVDSLTFRLSSFYKTVDLAFTHPFTGIGLGQYAYYTSPPNIAYIMPEQDLSRNVYINTKKNPHSFISQTLAETGLTGFFILIILIGKFMWHDVLFLKKPELSLLIPLVIAFWTLFLYGLFSSFDNIFISSWFWILRGVIEALYDKNRL